VNCKDVDWVIIEETAASRLPPQVQAHVRHCTRCQAFIHSLNASVSLDSPMPATLLQIERGILADLRPVRPILPARYLFAAFIAIFISFVSFAVYRMGALAIAVMSPPQAGVILGSLAICAVLLAYSLVAQMVPGARHSIHPKPLQVGTIILLTVVIGALFQFQYEPNFWANGWTCLRAGILLGVLTAGPFWLVLRRGAILSPSLTGAATGLLAGLAGTTVLEVHCPNHNAWHILVSHIGVSMLCAIAGLVIGLTSEITDRGSVRLRHRIGLRQP
jgi:hypothetical protein